MMGNHSVPLVDGERLWYVTNRAELTCLDTRGFDDEENDGPVVDEAVAAAGDADVVWQVDLIKTLGVHPHERSTCCVACAGDVLLVCTGNGVDNSHIQLPGIDAPSFAAFDRNTGRVLWTDASPGGRILHGQWSSPVFAVLGDKPQAIMAGGDGWLYSFDPRGAGQGKSRLWWKFDGNRKQSQFVQNGRGTRNEIVATPVVYRGKVYVAMGQDPDHGEGPGRLWCLDPTRRFDGGDVSAELVVDAAGDVVPVGRFAELPAGARVVPNPQSAVIWQYDEFDLDGNGQIDFEETMHRSCGSVAVKDDLLYVADFSGLVHCVDAQLGRPYWTHDLFAACSGWNVGPLLVDDKVYFADEEGKVTVFGHSRVKQLLAENDFGQSICTTPIVANGVLFIAAKYRLFAIAADAEGR